MAIKDTDLISVRNRNRGGTGYSLDGNFHREFNYGETKKIPFAELKSLQSAPGGADILADCLVIENEEALQLLNMQVEPEYFYTEAKIKDILYNSSVDEFADFLDFAPEGAIEIAKSIAVKEKIFDVRKRDMLSEKTGVNITNAIYINEVIDEDNGAKEDEKPKERRVKLDTPSAEPQRRAATPSAPKYNIVSK